MNPATTRRLRSLRARYWPVTATWSIALLAAALVATLPKIIP